MKTQLLSLTILLFLFVPFVNAQPWMEQPYFNKQAGEANFYDVKEAFNKWSEGKDISKLKGIKRYKRWEWFYEPRVYPTGNFPDPAINWKEWQKFYTGESTKSLQDNANWTSIAPTEVPLSLDETSIHGMGRINYIEFHPTDTNTLLVATSQGGVWKTTDDGQSWMCLTDGLPILRTSCVTYDPSNPETIYLATGDIDYVGFPTISQGRMTQYGVGVLKSTDGGQTWNTTGLSFELTDEDNSLIRKVVVSKTNSDKLMAAGPCGAWRSDDGGDTWVQTSVEKIIDVEVNPLDDNVMYVSTFYNTLNASSSRISKSYDFGDTWTALTTGIPTTNLPRVELALAPSDTSIIYALVTKSNGGMYEVLKSDDAGVQWTVVADDSDPNILGWADGGMVASSFFDDDGGQGDYDLTLIVDPNNPDKVYSGGVNMWGSDDGGTTWDVVSMWVKIFGASLHADQHYSAYNPLSGEFFQSNDGGIYKTANLQIGSFQSAMNCINMANLGTADSFDDVIIPGCYTLPTVWENITGGIHNTEYYRFASCRSNENMIVGGSQDNGTYKYRNGEWINTFGGDGMEAMIDHYDDSIYYVTNYSGALSKTTDCGETFVSSLDSIISQDAGEVGDWVTPFVMHPVYSDTLYTAFQNIWCSPDGALTWEKISNIGTAGNSGSQSFRALAVAPSNTQYIYAARPGGIYATYNGGQDWQSISAGLPNNMITYIAIHDRDPETIWITMSGYDETKKVYKSTDAGQTWRNISGNLPNVSVNCIVYQDSTANLPVSGVYVGTDIGVYYSNDYLDRDSVIYWVSHSNGLPNVIVNELEIHHGAEKLRAATYGRGFWETDLLVPDYSSDIAAVKKQDDRIQVYPNPTHDMVKIQVSGFDSKEDVKVVLFSITGNKLIEKEFAASETANLNMSELTAGNYIVQVTVKNTHYTKKIVKY